MGWIAASLLAAAGAVAALSALLLSGASPIRPVHRGAPARTTPLRATAPAAVPRTGSRLVANVVSYGADPTGSRDSTPAIARAITAAESRPGSEVYFPAGRYVLDDPSRRQVDFTIDRPIHVVGAGPTRTLVVNELGARNPAATVSTTIFEIVTNPVTQSGEGDGTTISGMTLDAATYDAGTSIMDFANRTTLSDLVVKAPRSTNTYNPNAFGIRVIAVCNPTNRYRVFRSGNVVSNVVITGQGAGGQTELDLSCQRGSTVDGATIYGNGVDVFYCSHDILENLALTGSPTPAWSAPSYTWVITGSYHITLSNIRTSGSGGVIAPDVVDVTRDVTIANETMAGTGSYLDIGDSRSTVITSSHLEGIRLAPVRSIVGVDVAGSSFTNVFCKSGKVIEDLVGLRCP